MDDVVNKNSLLMKFYEYFSLFMKINEQNTNFRGEHGFAAKIVLFSLFYALMKAYHMV